jgi:hypothetical protein
MRNRGATAKVLNYYGGAIINAGAPPINKLRFGAMIAKGNLVW